MPEETSMLDSYQSALRWEEGWVDLEERAQQARQRAQELTEAQELYNQIQRDLTNNFAQALATIETKLRANPADRRLLDLCIQHTIALLQQDRYDDAIQVIKIGLGYGIDQERTNQLHSLQAVTRLLDDKKDNETVANAPQLELPPDLPPELVDKVEQRLLAIYDQALINPEDSQSLANLSSNIQRLFPEQAEQRIEQLKQRHTEIRTNVTLFTARWQQRQAVESINRGEYDQALIYNQQACEILLSQDQSNAAGQKFDEVKTELEKQERNIKREQLRKSLQEQLQKVRQSYTDSVQQGEPWNPATELSEPGSTGNDRTDLSQKNDSADSENGAVDNAETSLASPIDTDTEQPVLSLQAAKKECATIEASAREQDFSTLAKEAKELQADIERFLSSWEKQKQALENARIMLTAARVAPPLLASQLAQQVIDKCQEIHRCIPDYADAATIEQEATALKQERDKQLAAPLDTAPASSIKDLATAVATHLQQPLPVSLNEQNLESLATTVAAKIQQQPSQKGENQDNLGSGGTPGILPSNQGSQATTVAQEIQPKPPGTDGKQNNLGSGGTPKILPSNQWQQWLPTILSGISLVMLMVLLALTVNPSPVNEPGSLGDNSETSTEDIQGLTPPESDDPSIDPNPVTMTETSIPESTSKPMPFQTPVVPPRYDTETFPQPEVPLNLPPGISIR